MASRHDYAGKPRPTIDLRPPMVLRGFGNTPIPGDMFIPPGVTPPITDVTYAGTYPLRHYITNPPITTPEFPSNPPRATNKAPVRAFAPYDRLTNTRATTAQLGSLRGLSSVGALPAGAYSGAVGRVIRRLDPDTGAGLRGQIVGARLHGYDAPPPYLHGAHGAHGAHLHGLGALPTPPASVPRVPTERIDNPVFITAAPTETAPNGDTYKLSSVKNYVVFTAKDRVNCTLDTTRNELKIKAVPAADPALGVVWINYTTTAGVERQLAVTITSADAAVAGSAIVQTVDAANKILKSMGKAPVPALDWQSADVLRSSYDQIYKPIRHLYGRWVYCGEEGCQKELKILMDLLAIAKANPETKTLREVMTIYATKNRASTVQLVFGGYAKNANGAVFPRAIQSAVNDEFGSDVAKIASAVASVVIGAVLSAATMGAGTAVAVALTGAAITYAANQLETMSTKGVIRGFTNAIKAATLDPTLKPATLMATKEAMDRLKMGAARIVARARMGYRGTTAEEEEFRILWTDAQRMGATTQQPQVSGLEFDPQFQTLMEQIKTLRPDLVGLGGGDSVLRDPNDPKWIAAMNMQRAARSMFFIAGGAKLAINAGKTPRALTATELRSFQTAWTAFTAAWPQGIAASLNEGIELKKIGATLAAVQGLYAPLLQEVGIPAQAIPPGAGEYLPPPPPGSTVSTPGVTPVVEKQITGGTAAEVPESELTPDPTGGGTGPGPGTPGGDAGAGGGAGPGTSLDRREGGGDTEKASKGIPGWVWGAGALAVIGGFLLLRKG